MLIVFFVFCLAVIITYLGNRSSFKKGLEIAFVLLAMFFSVRYNYGNDYMNYWNLFQRYAECTSFRDLFDYFYSEDTLLLSEIGWGVINYLFKPLGFPCLVAALTFFELFIYYKMIKLYVSIEYQWLAVFILVFSPQLFLIQLSMLRQALAIVLVIYATHLFISKKMIPALICVLCSTFFHKSSLYVVPIFSLWFLYKKIGKYSSIFLVLTFIALYLSQEQLSDMYRSIFVMDNELVSAYSNYEARVESKGMTLGIGFLISYIPFFLLIRILWTGESNITTRFFSFFAALSFSLAPITYVESLLGRFVYYFMIFRIIGIPYAYFSIKNTNLRIPLLIILILISIYGYYSFMTSPTWTESYSSYHTIFDLL